MKDVSSIESLVVPKDVTVEIKARTVTVEGPRGKLVKNVSHIQMDIQLVSLSSEGAAAGIWERTAGRRTRDQEVQLGVTSSVDPGWLLRLSG
jgi:ribosomal protein L6P/L9E